MTLWRLYFILKIAEMLIYLHVYCGLMVSNHRLHLLLFTMGFLDRFFKSDSASASDTARSGIPWEMLESVEQLQNVIRNSAKKPKVIFKHSTRCGISRMVLKDFERGYSLKGGEAGFYLLDLLNHRDVSDAIAQKLSVTHQSPQVIVLKDELVRHTESHHGIDIRKIEELILNNN